jgi:bifunctional DNA-binding transcriptional regulator/antitoxin component of YhaV-PrlF toxin-antitoxin module
VKDLDTMTVSRVGQGTLPKWWRDASGLSHGGVVEVRPLRDGKNSIVLTPKPAKRQGAVGLLELFAACPAPFPAPARHRLPFK